MPDVLALRAQLLWIIEPIIYSFRDPGRLVGAQGCELGGEVCSCAYPDQIIVAADTRPCSPNLRCVDADHMADLEVAVPVLLLLGLDVVLDGIIDLQGTRDCVVALTFGYEDAMTLSPSYETILPPWFRISREAA